MVGWGGLGKMGEMVNAITLLSLSTTESRKSMLDIQRREQEIKGPTFRPKSREG
jgi:hypothetical protein